LPTGYHYEGRKTRCVDNFVRYPYPSMAISYYKKEFARKRTNTVDHKEAFNLEKESKIINPHKMELSTTMKEFY
jgi:hypothetical protein